jgi:hypothetical protein
MAPYSMDLRTRVIRDWDAYAKGRSSRRGVPTEIRVLSASLRELT